MATLTETRFAYGEALLDLGARRPEVVVLDADLYKSTRSVLFRDAFPDRFFDMGISEADMVSTAAGMAATGLIPYANSFAIFITGVCYMPIRTQIAYPALPVKLIGSSAGLTQGPDGASHQSLEDISLMRGLPNMAVISPADAVETRLATAAIADWPGPVYMRLGRYPVPDLFGPDYRFEVGKAVTLREGGDVAIFATGHMTWKALEAAELLAADRIEAQGDQRLHDQTAGRSGRARCRSSVPAAGDRRGAQHHRRTGQRRGRMCLRPARRAAPAAPGRAR